MYYLSTHGEWQLMNGGYTPRGTEIDPGRQGGSQGNEMGCQSAVELLQAVTAGQYVKCPLDLLLRGA